MSRISPDPVKRENCERCFGKHGFIALTVMRRAESATDRVIDKSGTGAATWLVMSRAVR
jgi:hypothetical protein